MTVYVYYRVSTDRQDYESQKIGVTQYCERYGIKIDKEVLDDGISGTVPAKKRNLWKIIKNAKKGDTLITGELSRLGRSTIDVLETCSILSKKGVNVYFVKQAMQLDNTPIGKMMTAILSAFAELERDLISQRTKEGLLNAKKNGKKLGRPIGFTYFKLEGSKNKIKFLQKKQFNKSQIARELNVSRSTYITFIKKNNLG